MLSYGRKIKDCHLQAHQPRLDTLLAKSPYRTERLEGYTTSRAANTKRVRRLMPNSHPATYQNKPLQSTSEQTNLKCRNMERRKGRWAPHRQQLRASKRRAEENHNLPPHEPTVRRAEKPSSFDYMQPTRDHWWKKNPSKRPEHELLQLGKSDPTSTKITRHTDGGGSIWKVPLTTHTVFGRGPYLEEMWAMRLLEPKRRSPMQSSEAQRSDNKFKCLGF